MTSLFTKGDRDGGDTDLGLHSLLLHLDPAVLGPSLLGHVQPGNVLDSAHHGGVDILGDLVNLVQGAVNPEPDNALVPFRLNVNIARSLVKGIAEEVVYRIDDVLVIRRKLIRCPQPHVLLQVSQVDQRSAELMFGSHDGALETEEFIDQLDDVRLGGDHGFHLEVAHLGDIVDDFRVKGIRCRDGEISFFQLNGKDKMLPGKGVRNRGGDQVEIQLQRVDLFVRNLPGFGQGLENSLLIQALGRIIGSYPSEGS